MTPLRRPATPEGLFLAVMHAFAAHFDQHAVLKGGMALRLLDSPRATTDIDYVFIPYDSKREIVDAVEAALRGIGGAEVEVRLHSKMLRAVVQVDAARVQVEVTVARRCDAVPMATGDFARAQGQPSQLVAVMRFDTARAELARDLRSAAAALTAENVQAELAPLLPPGETTGLVPKLTAAVSRLTDELDPS